MVLCLFVEKRVSVDSSVLIQWGCCKRHACFSLTIATDVLQLVDDDREGGEVATRMSRGSGEKDEVGRETAWRQCGRGLLSKRPSFVPPLCSTNPILAMASTNSPPLAVDYADDLKNSIYFSLFDDLKRQ